MGGVSHPIDRLEVTFDDESLVVNVGLVLPATLMVRLGLEALVNGAARRPGWWRPSGSQGVVVGRDDFGGRSPGHIDHADMLRAGATQRVSLFWVMAPSTLGSFLRSFTFGHVRQLDKVIAETLRRGGTRGPVPAWGP